MELCVKIKREPVTNCNPIKEIRVCKTTEVTTTYCVPVIGFDYGNAIDRLKQVIRGR